ncbi:MAG TPA: V4R domain-containing protein [Longimicrobiales bacterium]
MPRINPTPSELAIPAASLTALRQALTEDVGPEKAARALQQAGFAAGDAIFAMLAGPAAQGRDAPESDADAVARLPSSVFWRRLSDLFASRGWGRLSHEDLHPGVGCLESSDWIEADPAAGASRPSCFFTVGLLANLLGRIAGQPIGVLEVECRSRGDLRCRFLFGGSAAVEPIYAATLEGRTVDESLAELV